MFHLEVSAILRCPDNHFELAAAAQPIVDQLNAAIRAGGLVNRAGKPVERRIDGSLIRSDGAVLYPIIDQIPVLLRDDAILLNQLSESSK